MSDDTGVVRSDPTPGSNAYLDSTAATKVIQPAPKGQTVADSLRYEHPDYTLYKPKWDKYTDCYHARDIGRFIWKHDREHLDSYTSRKKRGYYLNYVSSVTDLFVSYLFQSNITRQIDDNSLTDQFKEFYEDADRHGTNYSLLIQQAEVFAIVAGHVGVLVDAPIEMELDSEEDRKVRRYHPYLTLVRAQQILDWELDELGKFRWVKLEVPTIRERDWRDAVDEKTRTFIIWRTDGWEKWEVLDDKATRVASGSNTLGEVPLVIVRNERSLIHPWFGESAVRDIADLNIAILNLCSLMDEEAYTRCLSVLIMEKSDVDAPVQLGHHNVLEYAVGTQPPSYLTPGETPLKLLGEQVERLRDEIYHLAKMGGTTGIRKMREATSGIAYAFEFNETNQSLAHKAECLEQAETEIHRLLAKRWTQEFKGVILYPREFGVDDFLTELQILAESRANLTSETAIKAVEKRLVNKFFARYPQDFRDKVTKEIDSGPGGLARFLASQPGAISPVSALLRSRRSPQANLGGSSAPAAQQAGTATTA